MNEKIINAIANLIGTIKGMNIRVLLLLFLVFITYIFKSEISHIIITRVFHKDRVISNLDHHSVIDASLTEVMKNTGADRAYIFLFHNGDAYYNGTHKNKMSCDYEVVGAGVSRESINLQNIPVSLFSYFIKSTIDMEMFYPDINLMENLVTRMELKRQGIKGIAAVPYYRDGKLFAIIGIDYVVGVGDTTNFRLNPQKEKVYLQKEANQIGALLM